MAELDWDRFCKDFVPGLLTEWGAGTIASGVAEDMRARASAFAASGLAARDVLRAPFLEEVHAYEPPSASIGVLAAISVVVRCSRLEEAHAGGWVGAGGIKGLTSMAAGPLSRWLHEYPSVEEGNGPEGIFERLDTRYPRSWAAFEALAQMPEAGRWPFRLPDAPVPELPRADEVINLHAGDESKVVLSGIEPRFDPAMIEMLAALEPGTVVVFSSFSRLSRNLGKMFRILEIILSRGASVLTTNHLVRPGEVFTRRGRLIQPDSSDPVAGIGNRVGLSGVHRRTAAATVQQLRG